MSRTTLITLGLLLAGLLAIPAFAVSNLPGFIAVYTVKKGAFSIGETTRALTPGKNGLHVFESITKPQGIARMLTSGQVIERSEWRFHNGIPRPERYSYTDSSKKETRRVELLFDWEAQRVTNTINGDPWRMDLHETSQDKLLYQLSLMRDLAAGKDNIQYSVADGGKLKEYEFEILETEEVSSPLGKFKTVPIRRISGNRTTTLWCAPALNYLPIRIEQRKDKKTPIVALLKKLDGIP